MDTSDASPTLTGSPTARLLSAGDSCITASNSTPTIPRSSYWAYCRSAPISLRHRRCRRRSAGSILSVVSQLKSLGVTIDSHLRFDSHANNVAKACSYHIRVLRHVRSLLTDDVALTVACSIVHSRLDYCNALLCSASAVTFDKLQCFQNNLSRVSARDEAASTPDHCSGRFVGSQRDSGSHTKWLGRHSRSEPQPLQRT